jgi:hypothetical protein
MIVIVLRLYDLSWYDSAMFKISERISAATDAPLRIQVCNGWSKQVKVQEIKF